MKAMIFAAGLGTRLKPLTNKIPKALVEINGKTLLEYAVEKLKSVGVTEIVINVHYLAHKIEEYLIDKNYFNIDFAISDERDELLNTGGGLKHAQDLLVGDEPFFVYNVDIVSSIDLGKVLEKHLKEKALVTLAVSQRKTSRYLLFNEEEALCAWENRKTAEKKIVHGNSLLSPLAFSGIQVVNPEIFPLISEKGCFSIIDVYLRLAKEEKIISYDHTGDLWLDIGKIDEINVAEKVINELYSA